QAEVGIRYRNVTGVQTCALPISRATRSLHCASVGKPSAPSAPGTPGSPLSPLAPLAPSAPGAPGSPLSPLGPCGPSGPSGPRAALAAPAASIRLSSAAVIGVPPAAPSAHLSGSKAIRHHLQSGKQNLRETSTRQA